MDLEKSKWENAKDVIIKVPQGTIVKDNDTGLILADLKITAMK